MSREPRSPALIAAMAEVGQAAGGARQLFGFPGGLSMPGHRELTATGVAARLPLPARLSVPMLQHVGRPNKPCVEPGATVRAGEVIGVPESYVGASIHAPASGRVSAIEVRAVGHQRVVSAQVVVIETQDDGEAAGGHAHPDYLELSPGAISQRIRDAGIVGLGGAGFPAHVKLNEGAGAVVDLLVINGVECEPYITCDDTLLRSRAADVVTGARIIARAVSSRHTVIVVEDDMPEAYARLLESVGDGEEEVVRVPARYPAGGEKQLIHALTGRHVPAAGLPLDLGVVMHNVGTAAAVFDAVVRGRALTERIVTVTGLVAEPRNFVVPIGTEVADLLAACGGVTTARPRVLLGGPMMGIDAADLRTPVTKTTNCVLVLADTRDERIERACIRCGDCVGVCPAGLQPEALLHACLSADYDEAQDFSLFECIECGCCAYVCPSAIPLVHHYRHAKSVIETMDEDHDEALQARRRSRLRLERGNGTAPAAESGLLVNVSEAGPDELKQAVADAVKRRRGDAD